MNREISLPGRCSPYEIVICESNELLRKVQDERPKYVPTNIQEKATDFLIDMVAIHFAALDKNGNVVGALRALQTPSDFPGLLENSALYQQPLLSTEKINAGVIEVSRVWTKPGKSFLFIQLMRSIIEYSLRNNVRYLIFSSEEHLEKIYLRLGCKIIHNMNGWSVFEADTQRIVNSTDVALGKKCPIIKEDSHGSMATTH